MPIEYSMLDAMHPTNGATLHHANRTSSVLDGTDGVLDMLLSHLQNLGSELAWMIHRLLRLTSKWTKSESGDLTCSDGTPTLWTMPHRMAVMGTRVDMEAPGAMASWIAGSSVLIHAIVARRKNSMY
jgi:hypothetical protein